MRDIFTEIFDTAPADPTEAARRAMRPVLRKRFYKQAAVAETDGGHAVLLDGKPVNTPGRRKLAAPVRPLADALAAEWNAQAEHIEPAIMPLTRLANSIIDAVCGAPAPVAEEVAKYLGSDMLLYRSEAQDGLSEQQARLWDPVLDWAADALGARFVLARGVVYVTQPDEAIAAARAAIPAGAGDLKEMWRLGAVSSVTTLTGSALLALALLRGRLDVDTAWAAAHVDEDWQMRTWGRDEQLLKRRAYRFAEMKAAAKVLAMNTPQEP